MTDPYADTRHVIAALSLLFYNYTTTDVTHLHSVGGHEFAYLWDKFVDGRDDTFAGFWELYERCGWKNKNRIIDQAMSRYSAEARQQADH